MNLVTKFLNFDKLMGIPLVKIVYFVGIVMIVLGVIGAILGSLTAIQLLGFGQFLGTLIAAPIGGVVAICFFRLACEIYTVLYRMGDDIAALRAGGGLTPPKT